MKYLGIAQYNAIKYAVFRQSLSLYLMRPLTQEGDQKEDLGDQEDWEVIVLPFTCDVNNTLFPKLVWITQELSNWVKIDHNCFLSRG